MLLHTTARRVAILITALVLAHPLGAQTPKARRLKVFVSVDMEGLAGVVNAPDVSSTGPDYQMFRTIMAGETNAAIEGAFLAGATEVLVRDGHGSKNNLRPSDVDPRARLLRGLSTGPKNMMEGIDSTFDAVVFVGYHAKAGTANAILEHTSTGNVIDVAINGVSLPEGGYNALVAGLYGVPAVFVAGDRAVVAQIRELLGPIGGVAVKEEINDASLGLSPKRATEEIRRGVDVAVRNRASAKRFTMPGPYTMVLKVTTERPMFPGAQRTGAGAFTYTSNSLLDILSAFNAMK